MSAFLAGFLVHSLKAAAVVLLVLLVQFLFRRWLPARFVYALWALVLLRLLMPAAPISSWSLFHLPVEGGKRLPGLIDLATTPAPVPESEASSPTLWQRTCEQRGLLVQILWLAGIVGLAARQLLHEGRLRSRLADRKRSTDPRILEPLEDARTILGLHRAPEVFETSAVTSPALHGFLRPRVLLPPGTAEGLSEESLRHVLLHELAHIKQRDHWIQATASVLRWLHWFNPLIHLAYRRMQSDREPACDALVLGHLSPRARRAYGSTLISLSAGPRGEASGSLVGMAETYQHLRRRVSMIAKFSIRPLRVSAVLACAMIVLAVVSLTDQPAVAADTEQADMAAQKETITDLRTIGSALHKWGNDQAKIEEGSLDYGDTLDWQICPAVEWSEIEAILVPRYLPEVPKIDGWGNTYEFAANLGQPGSQPCWIGIRSTGKDGRFESKPYVISGFEHNQWERDIVWIDGFFMTWPTMQ
ncbi:MAG: M56 family metallopeptidase [Acidobacteriota bacterium]